VAGAQGAGSLHVGGPIDADVLLLPGGEMRVRLR